MLFIYKRHIFIAFLPCIRASWNTKSPENSTFPSLGSFYPAAIGAIFDILSLQYSPPLSPVGPASTPFDSASAACLPKTAPVLASADTYCAQRQFSQLPHTRILNSFTPRHFPILFYPAAIGAIFDILSLQYSPPLSPVGPGRLFGKSAIGFGRKSPAFAIQQPCFIFFYINLHAC